MKTCNRNYHHTFQWDYRNGNKWWHYDPTKWLIRLFSILGITKNLKTCSAAKSEIVQIEKQYMEAASTCGVRLGLGAGLAVIDLAASSAGNMAGLRAALDWLPALGSSLRAICISLAGTCGTEARLCSVRAQEPTLP